MGIFSRVKQRASQDAIDAIPPAPVGGADVGGTDLVADPYKKMPRLQVEPGSVVGAPVGPQPADRPLEFEGPQGKFDGSGFGTASGYLQAAARWLQPQLQAQKSEADAKSLAQRFLSSLAPELERRGGRFGGAKNETITLDGKTYDMFRDIGGLSEAQMLELGQGGGGGMGAGIGPNLASLLGGGSSAQAQVPSGPSPAAASNANLQKILADLAAANAGPMQQQQVIAKTAKQDALRDKMDRL